MIRMSGLCTSSGGGEPLAYDLAALRQADRLDDLVIVGEHRAPLLLVPEGREEIVEVAGEQRRCVGGEASREVRGAEDRHAVLLNPFAVHGALDIAAGVGGKVDDHAPGPHAPYLRIADQT